MEPAPRAPGSLLLALVVATLLRLWMAVGQPVGAYGLFIHDDALFVRSAASLVRGDWLGVYDQRTLAKRPFFPMFIAGAYRLGMPLPVAEHLLHVIACAALALALAPLLPDRRVRAVIYLALLFDPMLWVEGRVLRHRVVAGLALASLAGLVGILARTGGRARTLVAWGTGAGLALGAFWLTREESVWLAPAVGLLLAAAAARIGLEGTEPRGRRWLALALGPGLAAVLVLGVARINQGRYGVLAVAEAAEGEFVAAMAAVYRVKPAHWVRYLPAPAEVRRAMYRAVPSFRELEPFLEGESGRHWARSGVPLAPGAGDHDSKGGWFLWGLRDAAALAGYGTSAAAAAAYYRRLADEIDAACDAGELDCLPPRRTLAPPWHAEYGPAMVSTLAAAVEAVVRFQGSPGGVPLSVGPDETLVPFRELTGAPLRPRAGEAELRETRGWGPIPAFPPGLRLGLLGWIGWAYGQGGPLAVAAAGVLLLIQIAGRRPRSPLLAIAGAVLASMAALLVILAMVDVSLFPSLGSQYLVPLSPLVILVAALPLGEAAAAHFRTSPGP